MLQPMLHSQHFVRRATVLPRHRQGSRTCVQATSSSEAPLNEVVIKAKTARASNSHNNSQKSKQPSASSPQEVRAIRLQKVEDLRKAGLDPYAYRFDRTHYTSELQELHKALPDGAEVAADAEGGRVAVAGRVMAKRVMGKLAFLSLRDDKGQIQLYIDKARLEAHQPGAFEALLKGGVIDVGDIVGGAGGVRRTEKGELSVVVEQLQVLTKSLLPLPDKWHGLVDVEKRYRQRYIDMIVNEATRRTFRARSLVVSTIRRFLEDRGFMEVETPVLEAVAGGADARPFVTHHHALQRSLVLRIATELHLKRMVVGGFERVFELGRVFRNEGVSSRHNPEFTSVEMYQAYVDYTDMMEMAEGMVRAAAAAVTGSMQVSYQGVALDLSQPFRRVTMSDLVREATGGLDVLSYGPERLQEARDAAVEALQRAPSLDAHTRRTAVSKVCSAPTPGQLLNELFEELCEGQLVQPTFVCEHPVEISPLAKSHRHKPGVTERFELYVAGRELANAFSELTDPVEQRRRMEAQVAEHRAAAEAERAARRAAAAAAAAAAATAAAAASSAGRPETSSSSGSSSSNGSSGGSGDGHGKPHQGQDSEDGTYEVEVDHDFLTALEIGLPPTAGLGLGVDRLVMLLTDSASIRDVIPFPLMKA